MTTHAETIYRTCPACGVTFGQPNDPGRKRTYCADACRQAAYRQRTGRTGHEASRARKAREDARREEEARREDARREEEARRARERRARERARAQQAPGFPSWLRPRTADDATTLRRKARARKLWERATHPGTNGHEARACHDKLMDMKTRYGW